MCGWGPQKSGSVGTSLCLLSRVRPSLSHRANEDSPSCLPRLLLALCSKLATMFIGWVVFVFHISGFFVFCLFFCQARDPLPDGSLCSGSYGPDEAQQFTSNCGGDLSLILACCSQSHVTLVQPMLCFPRNLFDLF